MALMRACLMGENASTIDPLSLEIFLLVLFLSFSFSSFFFLKILWKFDRSMR